MFHLKHLLFFLNCLIKVSISFSSKSHVFGIPCSFGSDSEDDRQVHCELQCFSDVPWFQDIWYNNLVFSMNMYVNKNRRYIYLYFSWRVFIIYHGTIDTDNLAEWSVGWDRFLHQRNCWMGSIFASKELIICHKNSNFLNNFLNNFLMSGDLWYVKLWQFGVTEVDIWFLCSLII